MTQEDALRLTEFVKDHDKRFEAKAKTAAPQTDDAGGSHVLLTRPGRDDSGADYRH